MSKRDIDGLRKKAEEQLALNDRKVKSMKKADLETMAHELAVHQVELEMQNEELRQSRTLMEGTKDLYLDLFDFAPVGYFTIDEHSRVVEANLTGCKLLQVDKSFLRGKPFTRFISDDETDSFYLYRKKVLEKDIKQILILKMKKADGTVFHAQLESVKTGNERLRIAVSDVSERWQAEGLLEKSRLQLTNILGSISDGFFALDRNFVVTYFNAAAEELLGRSKDVVLNHKLFDAFPEAKGSIFEEKYSSVMKDKKPQIFETYFGVKPLENWYDVRAFPGEDGIVVFFQVTTERKKAEQALQESENHFREMFESHQAIMLLIEPETGRIVGANNAAAAFYGYPREVLSQMNIADINQMPEDEIVLDRQKAVNKQGNRFIFPHRLANGEIRTVEVNSSPINVNNNTILFSIIQDVTERQKAEENLKQRTLEVETVNKELEAFSYSVSHDLRAPLRRMTGFSTALLEDYAEKLDEQGKQYLRNIEDSSELMARLIDDLLKLARVTRSDINYEKVNLSGMAQKVVDELAKTEPKRKVDVSIHSDITAYGDRTLLRQVLENLLGNAWKYSSKTAEPRIEMGTTDRNGKLIYFIRDNGVGFDMAYADKLFKPFQRLHHESEFAGTGIGLAIVQRIIRRHGGEIWVESKVGEGATFYFTLN